MKIYVHRKGLEGPELVETEESATVAEIAGAQGGGNVWAADADDPLDPEATLAQAGIGDRGHVQVSGCKRVRVRVRFVDDEKRESFPPGATIAAVYAWATSKKAFELTETERAKHALGVCGTLVQLDKSAHIGTYADDNCEVCLDLAPKERFEG
jgi:hypothetical protein